MRPKLLEIEGLQSFRKIQKIDFELLSETGLFGIFGPTGSGKSTVLDAITLALYGKVKRAEGGTQGIINTHEKTARVSFAFELIRDGSRRNYRVERVYQRKKGTQNSSEVKIARLIEVTEAGEIPVCDKAVEVSNAIKDLLGLSHEDFTRAVVLPQNSFQEFLLLNNAERRGMLERIFYLEEYGKQLTDKLGRKMNMLRSRIDHLSGELKGYEDASDEAISQALKARDEAALERDNALKEHRKLESRFNEAKEIWSLVQELSHVMEKEQLQLSSKEKMDEKRVSLDKARKADSLLESIQKSKELSEKLENTENELKKVLVELPNAKTSLDETAKSYDALQEEMNHEQPRLAGRRARLEDALGIHTEVKALTEEISSFKKAAELINGEIVSKTELIKKETQGYDRLEQELIKIKAEADTMKISPEYRMQIQEGVKLEREGEALNENVKEFEKRTSSLKKIIIDLTQKQNVVKEEISAVAEKLNDLDEEKQKHDANMPADKAVIQKKTEKLHSFQAVYEILCFRKKELDGLELKMARQKDELEELARKASHLEEIKSKAYRLFEGCKQELENVVKEMDRDAAHRLSLVLKEGEPCPVCGSSHHPRPAAHEAGSDSSVMNQRIEQAREKVVYAEQDFKEAEKAVLLMGEKIKSLAEQNALAQQEFEQKTLEYNLEKSKLPDSLKLMDLEPLGQELLRMSQISIEKLNAIEAWEKEQENYKEKLQKLNEVLNEHRLKEHGLTTELKVNHESLDEHEKSLIVAQNAAHEVLQKYAEFLKICQIQKASAELSKISEMDHRLHNLQSSMEKIREAGSQKQLLLEKVKEELRMLNTEFIKNETELKNLTIQKDTREIRLRELAGAASIDDEIKSIEMKLDRYAELDKQYREHLQALEKQVNALENKKALIMNQKLIYTESWTSVEKSLIVALKDKGFTDINDVAVSQLPQAEQKTLMNEIEVYDQNGINIQAQMAMIKKKLNLRSITEEEWNQLSSAYQEIAVYKEECVSRSEVARAHYENTKSKHEKWVELNKSHQELTHKQGLFEQIQKILKAELRKDNSFIDYIAEERMRYVAAKASETLGIMTKYKYALELDTETGFNSRDNANGGVCRRVTSLSGGETFLTSLSLALALSEQIQLKGQSPLEFFFLDEGFGTLDNSLLDTVIDSLERLSKKERVIGLISHVPELRSRLGRRLIIDPPSTQGDGSRVRIEKA